jgi:DNA-binding response OmpR family regulator
MNRAATATPWEQESEHPRSSWQPATALVVDPDPVSRRFVELALCKDGEFLVEGAESAAGGVEILNRQLIELVISDTDLPDMNGLRFYRSLAQESRLRSIPFVFLSADKRAEAKVAAYRAGVAEYVVKPCHPAELAARAVSLVERERRLREHARRRNYMLAGDLTAISFPDLVNIIEMERRSGLLSLVLAQAVGQVFFDGGRIVHAVYGNLSGPEAFYRFVGETAGRFELAPGRCELPPEAWTISNSATALILEGARLLDVERASAPASAGAGGPVAAPAELGAIASSREIEPALEAEASLAVQMEAGLADAFSLGELCLWSAAELSRWTRRAIGTERLHVHLIADLPTGVSAILGVAGAPTERWVMGGLEPTRKVFGVTFFQRRERTIDVVLLDATQPDAFEPSLKRVPNIVILAPCGGDFMSMGIRSRVAIDHLLRRFRPPLLMAVGNASMRTDSGVGSMARHAEHVHFVDGILGEGDIDLRSLLVEAIRQWGTSSVETTVELTL